MRHGFWGFLSQCSVAAVAVCMFLDGTITTSQLFGQSDNLGSEKKTTEPVFRVPKLTDQKLKTEAEGVVQSEALPRTNEGTRVAHANPEPNRSVTIPKLTPKPGVPVEPAPVEPEPAGVASVALAPAPHPLDRAVDFAHQSLKEMRSEIADYTAVLAKREQVNGVIGEPSYINLKVRCPRTHADGTTSPFSIYMKFLRPKDSAGREVIWVEGQNDNKLIVHEGSGILRLKKFNLSPTCPIAMRGQRYPIYEAGLENLIVKLIEKAERDRAAGPCVVDYRDGAVINKRECSLIELVHNERHEPYEFHKAQVFIDKELNVPVRYAAYDWPESPGAEPKLLEEYTYYNVKANVGLTDNDFNPANPAYKFPRR